MHCDTAGECYNQKIPLNLNNLHIDLCKGEYLDKWQQFFAVWIPDSFRGKAALDYFERVLLNLKNEISQNNDKIQLYQGFSALKEEQDRKSVV